MCFCLFFWVDRSFCIFTSKLSLASFVFCSDRRRVSCQTLRFSARPKVALPPLLPFLPSKRRELICSQVTKNLGWCFLLRGFLLLVRCFGEFLVFLLMLCCWFSYLCSDDVLFNRTNILNTFGLGKVFHRYNWKVAPTFRSPALFHLRFLSWFYPSTQKIVGDQTRLPSYLSLHPAPHSS